MRIPPPPSLLPPTVRKKGKLCFVVVRSRLSATEEILKNQENYLASLGDGLSVIHEKKLIAEMPKNQFEFNP